MSIKRANASSVTKSGAGISDVPDKPTGLSATDSGDGTTASVSFTPAVTGGTPTSYTVTSSPGSFTGTGASSPISVTGLTAGTAYTFTATATNSTGTSAASSASSSLTLARVDFFLIERATVGAGGSSSVTFSSIPSTYTHLQLRLFASPTASGPNFNIRFNSDSGNNYTFHQIYGTGATVTSNANTSQNRGYLVSSATSSTYYSAAVTDILDYTNTNKHKVTRTFGGWDTNSTSDEINFRSTAWLNTAAITTITLLPDSGNFAQYSSFALYGIKGA